MASEVSVSGAGGAATDHCGLCPCRFTGKVLLISSFHIHIQGKTEGKTEGYEWTPNPAGDGSGSRVGPN